MRFRLPEGCAGVTLDGVALVVRDGFVEADAAAADTLVAHGIVPSEPESVPGERPGSKRARI